MGKVNHHSACIVMEWRLEFETPWWTDAAEPVGIVITAEERRTAEPVGAVGMIIDARMRRRVSPDAENWRIGREDNPVHVLRAEKGFAVFFRGR